MALFTMPRPSRRCGGDDMSMSTTTSSSNGKPCSNTVQFNNVEIREYNIILGDNPSCNGGPPLSISWDYDIETQRIIPLEAFELSRCDHDTSVDGGCVGLSLRRRNEHELALPGYARCKILSRCNVTPKEMLQMETECDEVKKQRLETCSKLQRKKRRRRHVVKVCTLGLLRTV